MAHVALSVEELARRVVLSFNFAVQLHRLWCVYLLHKDFDFEPELRNKIFVIYFMGLVDVAVDAKRRNMLIVDEATRQGNSNALHYMNFSSKFCDGVADILSDFDEREILFLLETRNQNVHGILNGHATGSHLKSYKVNNFVIDEIKVIKEDYWSIHRNILANYNHNVDDALSDLRNRFCNTKKLFWTLLSISTNVRIELVQEEIQQFPNISDVHFKFNFLNNNYFDTMSQFKGHSLADIRNMGKFGNQRLKDKVFP